MTLAPKTIKKLESLLTGAVLKNEPGIAVGIAQRGRLVWAGARGLTNLEAKTPMTPRTPFRICSISKQFACALAMREARAGRIDLSAHPSRYVPWTRVLDPALTVAHLMQNKSGIRDQWVMAMMMGAKPTQPFTLEDGNEAVRHAPDGMFAPGERNLYCNINFEIVGQILEAVTGQPYAELLSAHILVPLGMRDTSLGVDTSRSIPGDARGYRFHNKAWEEEQNGIHWAASAGMVSTAEDMLRWAACLRDPKAAGLPWVADILPTTPFNDGAEAQYAAGINRITAHGRTVFLHGGGLRGWKSLLLHFVNEETSIVVLMNRNNSPRARMPRAVAYDVAAALGILPVWRRKGVKPVPATLPPRTAGAWVSREQGLIVCLRQSKGQAEVHSFLDWSKLFRTPDPRTLATEDGHVRLGKGGMMLVDAQENVCAPMRHIVRNVKGEAKFAGRGVYRNAPLNGSAKISTVRGKPAITFTGVFGTGEGYPLTVLDAHTAYFDLSRGVDEAPPGRVLVIHDPQQQCIELSATLARRIVFRR
jgi:D-aminopeptidase